MAMIFIPSRYGDVDTVVRHFFSPAKRSIRAFEVEAQSLGQATMALEKIIKEKTSEFDNDEFMFSLGLDSGNHCAHLTRAMYDLFPEHLIWNVPVYESAEVNSYAFKQDEYPELSYLYNFEPFIKFTKEVVTQYYDYKYGTPLVDTDFRKYEGSEFNRSRLENIRALLKDRPTVLEPFPYLNFVADNLKMNEFEFAGEAPECLIFSSMPRNVLKDEVMDKIRVYSPKIILYETSELGWTHPTHEVDRYSPILQEIIKCGYSQIDKLTISPKIEKFCENKNVYRNKSFAIRFERKD